MRVTTSAVSAFSFSLPGSSAKRTATDERCCWRRCCCCCCCSWYDRSASPLDAAAAAPSPCAPRSSFSRGMTPSMYRNSTDASGISSTTARSGASRRRRTIDAGIELASSFSH